MNVLATGVYGRCGTAIIEHLHDEYDFTYLNRSDRPDDHPWGGYDTHVADVTDYEAMRPAFDGQDAVVHLAAFPYTYGSWEDVNEPNLDGMYNALEAAREAEVETFVYGSTNHVMGMYELDNTPEIYYGDADVMIDHTDPVRPDSIYGATKSFGEDLGRYYVEQHEYPKRFYAIRICSVRMPEWDHPYGDAERMVQEGEFESGSGKDQQIERGSEEYKQEVARMKSMWQSRRDFAHQVDCCLQDDSVEYGIFSGVSDNDQRWYDIEHARETIGYDPQDNGEEWDAPPE
ncbi:NAD-dependent epimerase/dehydratase family protein [Halosimplex pelagicum]|uniref:NAD(P)-dependent oxidoreductase n=1 Tax=Halosimplex pelagicum TaxID=869886 RepID=A0A7D5P8N9_9EURY|nr:NAD(P)-dependent oxidoreductase [Halosimplex pelagicum]QLH82021.1 NAD(P)-dependent oxidoreductase [Halosimplex pelagicum]